MQIDLRLKCSVWIWYYRVVIILCVVLIALFILLCGCVASAPFYIIYCNVVCYLANTVVNFLMVVTALSLKKLTILILRALPLL